MPKPGRPQNRTAAAKQSQRHSGFQLGAIPPHLRRAGAKVDTELAAGTSGASPSRNSGKRFKANGVSCAHRTKAFGTISVVTKLENGKKIRCRCWTAAPSLAAGLSTSRSAPCARSAATACAASPCVAPATSSRRNKSYVQVVVKSVPLLPPGDIVRARIR